MHCSRGTRLEIGAGFCALLLGCLLMASLIHTSAPQPSEPLPAFPMSCIAAGKDAGRLQTLMWVPRAAEFRDPVPQDSLRYPGRAQAVPRSAQPRSLRQSKAGTCLISRLGQKIPPRLPSGSCWRRCPQRRSRLRTVAPLPAIDMPDAWKGEDRPLETEGEGQIPAQETSHGDLNLQGLDL